MRRKEMDMLKEHCDTYFEQDDCIVIHPTLNIWPHIDVLLYKPDKKYPFWKMVTMGASDYKMLPAECTVSNYNEYMMFIDKAVDLMDSSVSSWFYEKLVMVATYAYYNKTHITFRHSIEWENDDPDDEMIAAFIEFPQIMEDTGVLRCKMGPFKTVACLQVILLNKNELEMLMEIGPDKFSNYLYPQENIREHFLSERHRSDKF